MTIYFTSDNHFRHKNIIKYCDRPFSTVDEMDRAMIERWNATVQDDDTIWHLGDFSLSLVIVKDILTQLKGHKKLVCGNHDGAFIKHKKHKSIIEKYIEFGFDEANPYLVEDLFGFRVCHLPYLGSEENIKYAEYRPKDDGKWLLHGHVHQLYKTKNKMINVGVDVWNFTPVRLETLIEIRNNKT